MNKGNFFRRNIFAAFIVFGVLFAAVVGATVKLYTAIGEDYANEIESQDIAKQRARDKAIKNATKEAGVYLKAYSRTVNSELTDDDIIAITSNAWQLVGEPKYTRTLKQISDNTTIILWTSTVEVNVDDAEIQSWIKRDDKEKSQIISQTREALKSSEENDRKIEDLREKYNRATSQVERDRIIKQMKDTDREFLANQKLEEGNKLAYAKDYYDAIKLYREALKIKPNWDWAYNNRGCAYDNLGQNERAIQDYDKAIELNPNGAKAYNNRGLAYAKLGQYERAIQDFDKAIELNPNLYQAYYNRGNAYYDLGQYERAIQDFNKAIELNPNFADAYYNRGNAYRNLKQYTLAIKDFNKALSLLEHPIIYNNRGLCYKALGDEKKAQADFAKAKELGYNG